MRYVAAQALAHLRIIALLCLFGIVEPFGLKPLKTNFIDYAKCNIPVKEITKVNNIIGIVTTIHKFVDANGKDLFSP